MYSTQYCFVFFTLKISKIKLTLMTHPQLPDDEPSHTALGPRLPLLSTNQTRENVTFCGFGVSGVIIKKNDSPYFGAMI